MNYEQFKAQLILDFIEREQAYPNDEYLNLIDKLATFAFKGAI